MSSFFYLLRHLIGIVVKDCSSPLDTRFTPPAPSLTTFQQRCIVLLLAADQKYLEGLLVGTTCAGDHFTDPFLDEISAVLFKRNSTFNVSVIFLPFLRNMSREKLTKTRFISPFSWKKSHPWRVYIPPSVGYEAT